MVVTTYNNPRSLELCLLSLENQSYQNFTVFIADDGSGDETRDLLLRLKKQLSYEFFHIWHPDQGYRKAKINNTVFKQINVEVFPVLICLDHDVILHPDFVADHANEHIQAGLKNFVFMGRRVDLSPQLTGKITPENLDYYCSGLTLDHVISALKGETQNVLRSVRLNVSPELTRLLKRDRVYDLLGSNYSISTELMLRVNGYNEDYQSYWGEDGDLFVRIRNIGAKIRGRIGYAVQWHLYHRRLEETAEHKQMYARLLQDQSYTRCKNGITKE